MHWSRSLYRLRRYSPNTDRLIRSFHYPVDFFCQRKRSYLPRSFPNRFVFNTSSSFSSSIIYRKMAPLLTFDVLQHQNAETSNVIMKALEGNEGFEKLSQAEGSGILARDEEDGKKLTKGVEYAKQKGVIDPNFVPEPYITIDVLGKSPDEVADTMIDKSGTDAKVIVLCGLSGTGKGTTVAVLKKKLEADEKTKVVCWSNGNVFRSVTLLAATWCEQQVEDGAFDPDKALTKENLGDFMSMLEFGLFNGKYDTRIHGLGLDVLVSEVQNTLLKKPMVSKNIPTVAQVTQGEVILFAAKAIETMGESGGLVVLLEGREQTVNYVRTPHRFTLVLSDDTLIGKRRAAQRLMAATINEVNETSSTDEIQAVLEEQLTQMAI
uniref:(d)CMP kinase n=1 Tax=Attheya septentrionalis TaxID=420275 RepID=A0A7S2XS30_9STRA|mmetsp:Transcript_24556/g.44427  ORF Transcript_24556/g.44427 Transcript_24556/m.44427 type:complete len:379 (+) Transcript_24556:11-1147(+)